MDVLSPLIPVLCHSGCKRCMDEVWTVITVTVLLTAAKLLDFQKIAKQTAHGQFTCCQNMFFLRACILTMFAFPLVMLFVLQFALRRARRLLYGCIGRTGVQY